MGLISLVLTSPSVWIVTVAALAYSAFRQWLRARQAAVKVQEVSESSERRLREMEERLDRVETAISMWRP